MTESIGLLHFDRCRKTKHSRLSSISPGRVFTNKPTIWMECQFVCDKPHIHYSLHSLYTVCFFCVRLLLLLRHFRLHILEFDTFDCIISAAKNRAELCTLATRTRENCAKYSIWNYAKCANERNVSSAICITINQCAIIVDHAQFNTCNIFKWQMCPQRVLRRTSTYPITSCFCFFVSIGSAYSFRYMHIYSDICVCVCVSVQVCSCKMQTH